MTRNLGMMAGLLVLAACGEKGGADSVQKTTNTSGVAEALGQKDPATVSVKPMGAQSFGIIKAKCSAQPTSEVTMILNSIFGGLDSNGKITRDIKQVNKRVPQIDPTMLNSGSWPTDLDFDASNLGMGPVKITIMISTARNPNKPGLHFLRPRPANLPTGPDPTSLDSSLAVLVPAPVDDFCDRTDIVVDPVNNTESVSFVMNRVVDSRSLNMGLLVPGAKKDREAQVWLPIFLDPNVRNQG